VEEENDHRGHEDHHSRMVADFRRRFIVSTALTLPVLALSPMIQGFAGLRETLSFPGDSWIVLALSTVIFAYGGWPFLKGLYEELGDRRPGMMTLIGVAVTVAYAYSAAVVVGLPGRFFFWELATLIDVMLLGHWFEMRSVMGASQALSELARLMPGEAHRITGSGSTEDVPVEELGPGDRVLVKPGEKIPVDGEVFEGESGVDEALVTGESRPVDKSAGDAVIGGSVNGEGSLKIEVRKTGDESYLSQVVELVERSQQSRSRTQDLADRVAMWLTIVALSVGTLTFVLWLVLSDREVVFSLERAVTVMVITCPHALGLAIPLVVAVSTSLAAGRGLLVRNRGPFERSRAVTAVVFDKTGTLTEGRFGVADSVAFGDADGGELLALAASVESESQHPIAKGIVEAAGETEPPSGFESIPGKGARAEVGGREVHVVSAGYLEDNGIEVADAGAVEELGRGGRTVVHVLVDGRHAGAVALSDRIRPEAREAVEKLSAMGVESMMLTGDDEEVARNVAGELGIETFFAEVEPGRKSEEVAGVRERGAVVCMVGDGVNDAPALAEADVGIAIGAGTDVAIETADVVLVRSNPLDVVSVIALSKETYGKMVQNLVWATGYNVLAIPLAAGALAWAGVVLSPAVGAVLMSLSTIIVAVNARLLGRGGRREGREDGGSS
jgi:Cu2+-exporting ATPase